MICCCDNSFVLGDVIIPEVVLDAHDSCLFVDTEEISVLEAVTQFSIISYISIFCCNLSITRTRSIQIQTTRERAPLLKSDLA